MYDNMKWASLDRTSGGSVPAPKLAVLWVAVLVGAVVVALVALLG